MTKSIIGKISIVLLAATLAACASKGAQQTQQNSGFLADYSKLQEVKDATGATVRFWANPKFTPANYNAILLEPLQFYPEPQGTDQVSVEELQRMRAYANEALKRQIGARFKMVDTPTPGAVRIRSALSGVAAEGEGLKPYQYVPTALVITMAKRAATGTPQRAFIVSETEARDSVSNELLAQKIKVGEGKNVKLQEAAGQQVITLETVQPLIDELAAAALPNLDQFVRRK